MACGQGGQASLPPFCPSVFLCLELSFGGSMLDCFKLLCCTVSGNVGAEGDNILK